VDRLRGPQFAAVLQGSVHPHVKKLLALQSVDQEVASLTKDIDSLPAEEAKRRKKLDDLDRIATEGKA